MADNGDQCIFPFRRPSDGTIVTDNTCFNGGCAIRLTDKARMKEAGACMPGCLGSNVLIVFFLFYKCFFYVLTTLIIAKDCPDSVTLGQHMTSNFSAAVRSAANTFEAKCEDGHAFFHEDNGDYTAHTTLIGTCTYDIDTFDMAWKYEYGSNLGDCVGNIFV